MEDISKKIIHLRVSLIIKALLLILILFGAFKIYFDSNGLVNKEFGIDLYVQSHQKSLEISGYVIIYLVLMVFGAYVENYKVNKKLIEIEDKIEKL